MRTLITNRLARVKIAKTTSDLNKEACWASCRAIAVAVAATKAAKPDTTTRPTVRFNRRSVSSVRTLATRRPHWRQSVDVVGQTRPPRVQGQWSGMSLDSQVSWFCQVQSTVCIASPPGERQRLREKHKMPTTKHALRFVCHFSICEV